MRAFFDQYGEVAAIVGGVLLIVLAVWVAYLSVKLKAVSKRWNDLMNGTDGANLESLLKEQTEGYRRVDSRLASGEARLGSLETKMESAKRYVGVVRYDAFQDVGGGQSFAMAIYDEEGDGAVITSQVGRTDCRVFAKEIHKGKANRELSEEEQRAIEAAVGRREVARAEQ